jgi:hypothetical protein
MGVVKVICPLSLVIFARAFRVAALPQAGLEEFDQSVNQPLLSAYDVETALMTVLLENFAYIAFQISHRPPPEGIQRNSAVAANDPTNSHPGSRGPVRSTPHGRDTFTHLKSLMSP